MNRNYKNEESMKTQKRFEKHTNNHQHKIIKSNFYPSSQYLHLLNSVLDSPGIYSYAVDSFIELIYYCVYDKLKVFTHLSNTPYTLFTLCQQYDTLFGTILNFLQI